MSTYEISKSSLLSLKAEILRKKEESIKTRQENKIKIQNIKKNTPLDLKNRGVEQREQKDYDPEEEDLLRKSRSALEAKSKLYDKLVKGAKQFTDDEIEHNRRYLVRFDRKNNDLPPEDSDGEMDIDKYPENDEDEEKHFSDEYEPAKNPDEEWVEYTDCLGRTRKCMRKDLELLKSKDKEFRSSMDERKLESGQIKEPEEEKEDVKLDESNELLSSDMRREILRRQWEEEEEALRDKSNIHYQDVLFNEARTHGVGYYGFSKDEEVRAKQQEALKKLREETQQQQKKAQELRLMREKQLAARAKAAKNRKRARLGLPPEEENEVEVEKKDEPEKLDEEEQKRKEKEAEKQKILEKARRKHVRPWDIGKDGVKKEHYEYTQDEWVDRQRKERNKDFAPPSTYKREFKSNLVREETNESDKLLYFSTKKDKQVVNPYKINDIKGSKSEYLFKDLDSDENVSVSYNIPIVDECDEMPKENATQRDFKSSERNKGVEIAPPPTYDYYGPSNVKQRKVTKEKVDIEDSIAAGLKFLRQQAEKKNSSSKHPQEMFLS